MAILVTGAAGFIGFHLSLSLLNNRRQVIGIDDLNDYYDVKLKKDRLSILKKKNNFYFHKVSLENKLSLKKLFNKYKFTHVINLAAYAGVRHSLLKPQDYIDANITGFLNILEESKTNNIKHVIYASSSSIYGTNTNYPFLESDNSDHPVSLYGATKKANELIAHTYSHLFNLPTTGLRFFTVYGPWGRPDMALFKFTKAIIDGSAIEVYNKGNHQRDFTYIDDIVKSIIKLIQLPPPKRNNSYNTSRPDGSQSNSPWRIYNIGNNETISLTKFIKIIEKAIGKKAKKKFLGMQLGDVKKSYSSTRRLKKITGFKPYTPLKKGIEEFIKWYKEYYNINS